MEMDGLNQALDGNGAAQGSALVDKGIYNIGVRPIAEDIGRGGNDAFGFPLSAAALSLRNAGVPIGVFANPGNIPAPLPGTFAPYVSGFPIGLAFPLINQPLFLPNTISPTVDIVVFPSGTYPNPNRIARNGSFKVPQLRNVELTGPYFHNGGMLTLRQVVDFYSRGGDFPITNAQERDPLIVDLHVNFGALFTEPDKLALVDLLLAFTDQRVKFEKAPFDHPEIIVPVDGTAPDNTTGRTALLADARFMVVPAVGAAGRGTPLANFLDVSSVPNSPGVDHFDSAAASMLVSFSTGATVAGAGIVANEDIASLDTTTGQYTIYFDGSDVGLANAAIDAFAVLPGGNILMSFASSFSVPGLTGGPGGSTTVSPSDIVRFVPTSLGANTAGSFAFYFDGSDVGLTTLDENVDAIGLQPNGDLVLSITGLGSVPGVVTVEDEDLLRFAPSALGATTAGTFSVFFDGSDVGLGGNTAEDVDAVFIGPANTVFVSTVGAFSVPGVTGNQRDVLQYTLTSAGATTAGTASAFLRGAAVGMPGTSNLSGIFIQ